MRCDAIISAESSAENATGACECASNHTYWRCRNTQPEYLYLGCLGAVGVSDGATRPRGLRVSKSHCSRVLSSCSLMRGRLAWYGVFAAKRATTGQHRATGRTLGSYAARQERVNMIEVRRVRVCVSSLARVATGCGSSRVRACASAQGCRSSRGSSC